MAPRSLSKRKAPRLVDSETPEKKRNRYDRKSSNEEAQDDSTEEPEVGKEDDICPICQLLLYRPVTTRCRHTICESCMLHWADVSVISQMTIVSLDDDSPVSSANAIEARCPMCRTPSTASLNKGLAKTLKTRYPTLYRARALEEAPSQTDSSIETITLYIGNTHRLKARDPEEDYEHSNIHEWIFFVRPSEPSIIEEVQIFLHPTFRQPRVILSLPPYEIRRLGWGTFTLTANVILRAGYSWVSDAAERPPNGAEKGMLPLHWTLNFDGRGSQGKCRLKVKRKARPSERGEEEPSEP